MTTPRHTRSHTPAPVAASPETVGELRQDLITGNWVVIAKGRAQKSIDEQTHAPAVAKPVKYKDTCPFCNLNAYPQEPDVIRLPDDPDHWQVHIFGNKYPAFVPDDDVRTWHIGPYRASEAGGYHELLATRWHHQTEAAMSLTELSLTIEALVLRYRQLKTKPSVNYIQIIRNHGALAGASQEHPHHQLFTTPVLPRDIHEALWGAERYAKKHGQDPFTALVKFEQDSGERLVWENEHFVIFCPYASRVPFETWIMPKQPEPFFENLGPAQRESLAEALSFLFRCLHKGLNDPAYNYFIHSAPCDETGFVCDKTQFKHFRWHLKVMPRFGPWAGFELSTGLEIVPAVPEESAAFLRNVRVAG